MNNIGESNKRVLSAMITCAIAGLLIFSGPSSAITVSMSANNGVVGQPMTITSTITINTGELIPITSRTLAVTKDGSTLFTCTLPASSTSYNCGGTTIGVAVSENSWGSYYGYKYGYGYGYDSNATTTYGYKNTYWGNSTEGGNGTNGTTGYGYKYETSQGVYTYTGQTTLTYTITFTPTSAGAYTAQVAVTTEDDVYGNARVYLSETPATFTVSVENVIITEIMANPIGDDQGTAGLPLDGEWVEIYNNGSTAVNVSGWMVKNAMGDNWTISSANSQGNVNVVNGAYLVVYRNGATMALNDSVDIVNLTKANGTVIDSVSYNSSALGAGASFPEGTSASRSLSTGQWSADSTPSPMQGQNDTGRPPFPTLVTGYVNYSSGHPDSNVVINLLNTQVGSNGSGAQAVINTTSGKCMYTPANSYGANNSCNYSSSTGFFQIELYGTNAGNGDSINVTATDRYNKTNTTTANLANNISAGNVTTDIGTIMLETSATTIPLYAGWNLISIPVHPQNTSTASVLSSIAGNYTSVQTWIGGTAKTYYVGFGGGLTDINETMGFWIYMNNASTLTVQGSPPVSRSINLLQGWNLVGYLSTTPTLPTPTALISINGSYTSVQAWMNGEANTYYIGFGGSLQNMSEKYGYWIYANQTATLAY
ncbi:MAG: hypothetical protein MSIBF_04565 [Candidatus Altiarchaeales archaeon IMC4]|nr:MAG: hypothetical protein MSIBF_04565 [Candidatus Altiarchaeales archaeon IMC4]